MYEVNSLYGKTAVPRMLGRSSLSFLISSMYPFPVDGTIVRLPKLSKKRLGETFLPLAVFPLFLLRRLSRRGCAGFMCFHKGLQTYWRSQGWKFTVATFSGIKMAFCSEVICKYKCCMYILANMKTEKKL